MPAGVKLTSRIPEIIAELEPRMREAVSETADQIVESAKQKVPVRTGRLRDSIHSEARGRTAFAVVVDATNNWARGEGTASQSGRQSSYDFPYGIVVEFGSIYQSGQPFLIPALEESHIEFVGKAREALARL